jgi:hypothetical protein
MAVQIKLAFCCNLLFKKVGMAFDLSKIILVATIKPD